MLTESYGNSLSHQLSALSCLQWAGHDNNDPWTNYVFVPEEPEEEVAMIPY